MSKDPAMDAIHVLLQTNPGLAKDPVALRSVAQQYGVSADHVFASLGVQTHQNAVHTSFWGGAKNIFNKTWGSIEHAAGSAFGAAENFADRIVHGAAPVANRAQGTGLSTSNVANQAIPASKQAASGAWSAFGNAFNGLWKTADNLGGLLNQAQQDPIQFAQQRAVPFVKSAVEAIPGLARGTYNTAVRLGGDLSDIHSGNLGQMGKGAKDLAGFAGEQFMAPRTLLASTMSDAKRNGWSVALGHLFPAATAAFFLKNGASGLTGAELGAQETALVSAEARAATLRSVLDSKAATGGLSVDDMVRLSDTAIHLRNTESEIANLSDLAKGTGRSTTLLEKLKAQGQYAGSKWDNFARNYVGSVIGKGINFPVGMMRAFNRTMSSGTVNMTALLNNPRVMASDPAIYKEALQGKVIDKNGNVTTVGNEIASALNQQGMFHEILARVLDADLTLVVKDPFVKAFDLVKQAKSFSGFTGTLNRYWGGLGLVHAGDLTRAYNQYASVRRAIDFIAKSSPAQILSRFGATMFSGKMLRLLEEAKTPDAVLSVLEDAFSGAEFVHATAPTMSWYSAFKSALGGKLGEQFGTLGKLLESDVQITKSIVDDVKAQNGLDISPRSYTYQRLNAAGKLRVSLRQRFRAQFIRSPEWYNKVTGKMTNRDIVPGSIEAVEGIMNMLRSIHLPETTVLSVGDALIHSAADPMAYRTAYRQALYQVIMRPQSATMAAPEFEALEQAVSDDVWTMVDRIAGNDGGGNLGNYVASPNEYDNEILTDIGIKRAGIGSTHLGMLKLPTAREMRRLQRNVGNIVLEMRSYGAQQVLTDTTASLKQLIERAEFSDANIEKMVGQMKRVLTEKRLSVGELWESENLYKGYAGKFSSLVKQYEGWLGESVFRGRTGAERVALVAKDVSDQLVRITERYNRLASDIASRLGVVPPAFEESAVSLSQWAAEHGTTDEALLGAIDHLRGERQAVEDILANMNAHMNLSFDAGKNVIELGKLISTAVEGTKEARAAFAKDFKKRWDAESDRAILKDRGKRNLRSNREILVDFFQAYNNKYFKPMTLSSPGWAIRVSGSELSLNTFRVGGRNMFESHLAASIAKNEFKLAEKYAAVEKMGKQEKLVFRNAIRNMFIGMETELLNGLSNPQLARLVDDAVDLFVDHDGHLLMNMDHSGGDVVDNEAVQNKVLQMVHGTDEDGKVTHGYYYRGENFTTINGTDAGGGTALHEALNRIYNDSILSVGARYLNAEAQRVGTLAFAADEAKFMDRVYKEAVKRIEGGPNKIAWEARNRFLSDMREELSKMSEFKALNEEERKQVLAALDDQMKSVEDLVADDFPKSTRAKYDAVNRNISRIEDSVARVESEIARQEEVVKDSQMRLLNASEASEETRVSLGDALDEADSRLADLGRQRAELDKAINEHPFRRFYSTLESGAALKDYKPILSDLRREMATKIEETRKAVEERIHDLMGKEQVVLPRGGFAEMSDERMLSFRDSMGNPVPNEDLYREIFEKHPELWSDNELYSKYLPAGMPGVHGRDFLDAIGDPEKIASLQRLVKQEQQLDEIVTRMAHNDFKGAYNILDSLDPTSVDSIAPLLTEGTADLSRATSTFAVRGVPPELILGYGRTQDKTLADLAMHVQRERALRPNMFRPQFHPHYAMDATGEREFKADFEKYIKALASKSASDEEKDRAARWFTAIVSENPDEWATTANKVWKQNIDAERVRIARAADRKGYYDLLEQRKQLSAQRSRVGVEKRQIIKNGGIEPIRTEEEVAHDDFWSQRDRLEALYRQREATDARLTEAHARRDIMEQHVVTQDAKYRSRVAKDAMRKYNARIRKGTKGMGPLLRRIEARTATMNAQVERQARNVIDDMVSGLSSRSLSGDELVALKERLADYMHAHFNSMSPEELARYERAHQVSAVDSTGDPLMDWANVVAQHLVTLSSGYRGTFFPEIAAQMATGETWGAPKMARWLSERARNGEDYIKHIPARPFISPLAKGSRTNLLIELSNKMHSKVLGPIVNELIREPLFVCEYHARLEELRVKVAQGLLTLDQAKVIAKTDAVVNMNKYVHDPLGKQVWENNMRVAAPYYFAKNQAMRRAMRLAGGDMGAFYRYLRMNLAVTNYVGQNADGSGTFAIPGSQAVGAVSTGVGGILSSLMYGSSSMGMGPLNLGFDANPASLMSVIVTGTKPGAYNIAKEMIAVPFGPAIMLPAKFIYEYVTHKNPEVEHVMSMIFGENAMRSTFQDDLLPNPLLRNLGKGAYGFAMQNNTSSFASVENLVIQDLAQKRYEKMYVEVQKEHPTISSQELAMFGSKEQLWSFYASNKFADFMNDSANYQQFLDEAKYNAAVAYVLKSVISYSSPVALSLGARFAKSDEFKAIQKERDPKTHELLYPTYFLAADEFAKRYPDRVFDLVSRTKSSGARWPETKAALDMLDKHWSQLGQYSDAMAFLVANEGAQYDPRALQMEYSLGLRSRQTPKEFMNSLLVTLGWRYYNSLYEAYKANPDNLDPATGTLNYQAAMALRRQATLYGQTTNNVWLADKNSGVKNSVAYKTYGQMKQMIDDPKAVTMFQPGDLDAYKQLVNLREGYVQAYKDTADAGQSTGRLRSQWYDYCTQLSTTQGWDKYSSFITTVLRNLPAPQ